MYYLVVAFNVIYFVDSVILLLIRFAALLCIFWGCIVFNLREVFYSFIGGILYSHMQVWLFSGPVRISSCITDYCSYAYRYYSLDAYYKRKLEKEMKKGFAKVVDSERTVFNDEEQRR